MPEHPTALANAAAARALVDALTGDKSATQPLRVYVSPGSRSTPMVLALAACPRAQLAVVLDERAAAFVALGEAQASGVATAVLTTSGSAAAHALPAAIEAHHAGIPLLVLTADRPPAVRGLSAPQATVQQHLYQDHSRLSLDLPVPQGADAPGAAHVLARWALAGSEARARAEGSWPGPVHLNLPFAEPLGTAPADAAAAGTAPRLLPPLLANAPAGAPSSQVAGHPGDGSERPVWPTELAAAAKAFFAGAERGLIVCGPQAPATLASSGLGREVFALAAHLAWPVIAEASANLGAHPLHLVCAETLLGSAGALAHLPAPDRVLHIGLPPAGRALSRWLSQVAPGGLAVLNPEGLLVDPFLRASWLFCASPAEFIRAARRVLPQTEGALAPAAAKQQVFCASWLRADRALCPALAALAAADAPLFEGSLTAMLACALPPTSCLVIGNSLAIRDLDAFGLPGLGGKARCLVAARRGVSGIDGALAHTQGIAAARPIGSTFSLMGDLTFLHDCQSLRLLAQGGRAVRVVVLDNGGGGIFSLLPIANNEAVFEPLFRTPQQVDPAALVAGLGGTFRAIHTGAELARALAEARAESENAPAGKQARGAPQGASPAASGVEVWWMRLPESAAAIRQQVAAELAALALAASEPGPAR